MTGQIEVVFAGFGGQGVMTAGQLLAYTAMDEGKQVAWIPSYGPEMRGGTANCTVVVSEHRIGSPIINNPGAACVFNRPSLDKFGELIRPGGLLLINSSLIDVKSGRDDVTELLVPVNDIAIRAGNPKAANMVMLAAFVAMTDIVSFDALEKMFREKLGSKKKELLEVNLKAFAEGRMLAEKEKAGGKA
ncbi:MAG: 2-oxoacid:acceptor oxidoreductase family protein [candidate division Zixibacteria bacterium]|nr:2-oxoacid:acceptor oxidoreductase family protein [candidate division Zixibacteria bacterium]